MSDNASLVSKNVKNDQWTAWVNMMSSPVGTTHTLHVLGVIDTGNVSDSATISFDSLMKSNPPILVLRISHKTIFFPRQPGDTKVVLHYQQPGTPGQYAGVIVVYPDGNQVEIDQISTAI